jgi:uncharacterized protein YbcC (UPF0753/DUF2309 family)
MGDTKHNQVTNGSRLRHCIEHAAHLLPGQGPITAFVHHNTLHAFESLPFEKAVVEGGKVFDCHPFLPEERYRAKLERGRFEESDLVGALKEELQEGASDVIGQLCSRLDLRLAMLAHPLLTGPTAELKWVIEETGALQTFKKEAPSHHKSKMMDSTRHWIMRDRGKSRGDAGSGKRSLESVLDQLNVTLGDDSVENWSESRWESLCLKVLWVICRDGVAEVDWRSELAPVTYPERLPSMVREVIGQDADQKVNDVLIRFCSSFLDQDFAVRPLPQRSEGFMKAFQHLYRRSSLLTPKWQRNAFREIAEITCPIESIEGSLAELGVDENRQETYISQTLLALRGFAGMIWQLEIRGDRVARPIPKGSLIDYLAVRLILEKWAVLDVAEEELDFRGPAKELTGLLKRRVVPHPISLEQCAFQIFQLAQLLGWQPEVLHGMERTELQQLVSEVLQFSSLERRRVYHLAFERRYRDQTLNAVAAHGYNLLPGDQGKRDESRPTFQIVCCIDEREESFRRALEETDAQCETFGAAGFFAVAMNYRGAADAHFTPLCPVIIEPKHYVLERPVFTQQEDDATRRNRRRTIGTVTHQVHLGSRTFAGGWVAATLGALASVPLVMRILFPRSTARLRSSLGGFVKPPAETQLSLEREQEEPGKEDGHTGYSLDEMSVIVERLLRDIGLTRNFARIVIIAGHGSSSLNNPHEAAHDCGACGGGRGGPNARAFALMANHPLVRERIAARGLVIPRDTIFVGSYHNTCDESMTYYDLGQIPSSHADAFSSIRKTVEWARRLNAHERCRRFHSASFDLDPEGALRHVEGRAEDLAQVRPEYGHATNALCFVGRRSWSRHLFCDRRAFLQSYDPAQDDDECTILTRILQAVIPVCGGINLEYFFSYVDPVGYGCGTKLPHNITSLLGVMNGPASDLRTGLPWQMVEIHEPVRLLFVIESTPEKIKAILAKNPPLARLVEGHWVRVATYDPGHHSLQLFRDGAFEPYSADKSPLPVAPSSMAWYRGWRDHLGFSSIQPGQTE